MLSLFKRVLSDSQDTFHDTFGCFGKMPFTTDLVRHNTNNAEIRELSSVTVDAIQGLEKKKPQGIGQELERMPVYNFILTDSDQAHASAGLIFASRDSQNRPFPFMIFNNTKRASLKNQYAVIPVLVQEFLEKANDLAGMDWKQQSLENLRLTVDNLPQTPDGRSKQRLLESQVDLLDHVDIKDFWQGLKNWPDERAHALYLSALQALLSMITSGRHPRNAGAIRLPLPDSDLQLPFIVFLIQVLELCLAQHFPRLRFFWHRGNEFTDSALIVFFRPLSRQGMMQLFDRTIRDGAILQLDETARSLSDPARQALQLVRLTDLTLMEAVFKWTQLICPGNNRT